MFTVLWVSQYVPFLNNQFTISTEAIMHLVYPPPQKNCVHRWKRSFEFIINWKNWSGKILGVNKVPYGLVKNCQVDSWHWWQILQDTLHSKKNCLASTGWREYVVSLLNSSLPHVSILLDNGTNKRVSYDTCDDKHWRYNCHSNFSWFRHDYVSVRHDNWNYI